MADLLKQMWFLLTIEMYSTSYGVRGQQVDTAMPHFEYDIKKRARIDIVIITICSALLKCTASEFRTRAVLTAFSLYTKSEP